MVTVNKITYKPYRGEIEPITAIRATEIILHENHIEVISSYDWETFLPEADEVGYSKSAVMFPKASTSVEVTESWHERDPKKTPHPLVRIMCGDWTEHIHVRTEKEAYEIYTRIKQWMLR